MYREALIYREALMGEGNELLHFIYTQFGGNPASMAIAEAVLDVIEEEKLQERSKVLGEFMTESLLALKEKHNCIGDVRGVGMFIGVDLVKDKETREPDVALAEQVRFRCCVIYNHPNLPIPTDIPWPFWDNIGFWIFLTKWNT